MKKIKVRINNEGKMQRVKSNRADLYTIPMDIEALTIGQAQQIFKAVAEDEDYLDFLSGAQKERWSSELLVYARKATRIMAMLGGFDVSAVELLRDDEVMAIAPQFEMGVLRPLYIFGMYEPREFRSFTFEGVEFEMPASINDGFGGVMPMAEASAEEWAESNDLRIASTNPMEYAHLILAILCRPKGEKYNERVARERAEKFKDLSCSIAFDVFFCRLRRTSTILAYISEYLTRKANEAKAKAAAEESRVSANGKTKSSSQQATATEESCQARSQE